MDKKSLSNYDSPFKGVSTYELSDSEKFYGRNDETIEIVEKIKNNNVTLIYGRSGVGKSSLLNAGVIPLLCQNMFGNASFKTARIVLDVNSSESYESQMISKFVECFKEDVVLTKSQSLKLFLSDATIDFIPVFIIDQFEETYYHDELQTNVEKRRELFKELNNLLMEYAGYASPFRIVLSFREDYLSNIEDDTYLMPQLCDNRYRLLPLTIESGKHIVRSILMSNGLVEGGTELDEYLVQKLVAGNDRGWRYETHKNDKIDVMDLSLYCRMVDELRNLSGFRFITKKLIDSMSPDEILSNYYKDALSNVSKDCVEFIEECLLDDGRKKRNKPENYSKRLLLGLALLRKKGIVRFYESTQEYEISHDKICFVAQREKDSRLRQREEWMNYFILFPFFLFVGFAAYFLLNAVVNEISPVFFSNSKHFDEGYNSDSWLAKPIVHLLGNASMLLLAYYIPNYITVFLKRQYNYRFVAFGAIATTLSIVLCLWHYFYFTPLHTVFRNGNESHVSYSWYAIYIFLVLIPLVLTLLSAIKNAHYREEMYSDILLAKQTYILQPAKIYSIIILFVCLYLCAVPSYKWGVSSGESALFVLLIGFTTHSLFDAKTGFLRYWLYYMLFYLGLFLFDGEWIERILKGKLTEWPYDANIYIFILLLIFVVIETWISVKYIDKKMIVKSILINVIIVCLASLIYIGYIPFTKAPVPPLYKNLSKWNVMKVKTDGLYGTTTIGDVLLVPCLFDSVADLDKMVLHIADKNVFKHNYVDSIIANNDFNSAIFKKNSRGHYDFIINPQFAYYYSFDKDEHDPVHKYAFETFKEIQNGLINKLKFGTPMSKTNLKYAMKLVEAENHNVDTLFHSLKAEGNKASLLSYLKYLESVIQELNTLFLIETYDANAVIFSTMVLYQQFACSHFHKITMEKPINFTLGLGKSLMAQVESDRDGFIGDLSALGSTYVDDKGLNNYDYSSWLSFWKINNIFMRLYYLSMFNKEQEDYDRVRELQMLKLTNLHKNAVGLLRKQQMTYKLDINDISSSKNTLDSLTSSLRAIKNINDNTQKMNVVKQDFLDMIYEVSSTIFTSRKGHEQIWECCNKRLIQMRNLSENSFLSAFAKEIIRDLIPIMLLTEQKSSSDNSYNIIKEMEREDSLQNRKVFGGLMKYIEFQKGYMEKLEDLKSRIPK